MGMYKRINEVCKEFGLHKSTLRKWTNMGKIPHVRVGAHRLYDIDKIRSVIQRMVTGQEVETIDMDKVETLVYR